MDPKQFDSIWFEDEFTYTGTDLGAVYTKDKTTWKIWAPTASGVHVNLFATGSDEEQNAAFLGTMHMAKKDKGVWEASRRGDCAGIYYTYTVDHEGYSVETPDLYSRAVGVDGRRTCVIDLDQTDPEGWENDSRVHVDAPTDAIIWETHVRDFSIAADSGMQNKGKYLAFTEKDTFLDGHPDVPTGVAYLKDLGVTHVQLMPVFDYATVEEANLWGEQYNWGYDPLHFNVPEGSYSTDPWHGEVRVREMKQMIQALHEAGIGVIMDVVYNHTYYAIESIFHKTVPFYYHRMNDRGGFSNGSGCGNEVATERSMCRQFILDSIRYWVKEYHVDGFRFDLMGAMDITTMNRIREMLDGFPDGRSILMYGEPWAGGVTAIRAGEMAADKFHARLLHPRIGIFHDETRDGIKGSSFHREEPGFVNGAQDQAWKIRKAIKAWSGPQMTVKVPSQTVTYVSAHDNYTLWDKLVSTIHAEWMNYDEPVEERIVANKLAAAIVLTSQGICFLQSGEEFGRTKYGDGNSYRADSHINQLDWKRQIAFQDLKKFYKDLIRLRKAHKALHDPTERSSNLIYFSKGHRRAIAYTIPMVDGDERSLLAILINASHDEKEVLLETWSTYKLPEKWDILFDMNGDTTGEERCIRSNQITIPPKTVWILGTPINRR